MYLGSYRFLGDPDDLLAAYDRLISNFPTESLLLHLCVDTGDGVTIFDACPTQDEFRAFSTSAEFRAALDAVGLPQPDVSEIGPLHAARTSAGLISVS